MRVAKDAALLVGDPRSNVRGKLGRSTVDTGRGDLVGQTRPLLAVENLTKHFAHKGGLLNRTKAVVQAVDGVSFDVQTGETLGIVGESGCGKSTTARLLMHLIPPDIGTIVFDGRVVGAADGGLSHRDLHRQMQMVFQESYASLNPRLLRFSGSADEPESRPDDRPPTRRYDDHSPGDRPTRSASTRAGVDRPSRHSGARAPVLPIPARTIRRPAAADQHRASAGPRAAHRHPG